MSELSREEIDHLATLARLSLTVEEQDSFAKELPDILGLVDQLSVVAKMSSEKQPPTVPLAKLRLDEESGEKLSLSDLEKLAPSWHDNKIEVPAVFES